MLFARFLAKASLLIEPEIGVAFDSNGWNDLHYTRAAREAARTAEGEGR